MGLGFRDFRAFMGLGFLGFMILFLKVRYSKYTQVCTNRPRILSGFFLRVLSTVPFGLPLTVPSLYGLVRV